MALSEGLISYWIPDDSSGGRVLEDLAGDNHAMLVSDGPRPDMTFRELCLSAIVQTRINWRNRSSLRLARILAWINQRLSQRGE